MLIPNYQSIILLLLGLTEERDMVETLVDVLSWIALIGSVICISFISGLGRRRQRRLGLLNCPGCGEEIPKYDRDRFATVFWVGKRKVRPCPNCGVALQWAKWACRVLMGSFILIVATTLAMFLSPPQLFNVYWKFVLSGMGIHATAEYFQRFELAKDRDEP